MTFCLDRLIENFKLIYLYDTPYVMHIQQFITVMFCKYVKTQSDHLSLYGDGNTHKHTQYIHTGSFKIGFAMTKF
jgi:hypothetical protein